MTFDNDMIMVRFPDGEKSFYCLVNGIEWPPPEHMNINGFNMKRESISGITDEQRQGMSNVLRGAVFVPLMSNLSIADLSDWSGPSKLKEDL